MEVKQIEACFNAFEDLLHETFSVSQPSNRSMKHLFNECKTLHDLIQSEVINVERLAGTTDASGRDCDHALLLAQKEKAIEQEAKICEYGENQTCSHQEQAADDFELINQAVLQYLMKTHLTTAKVFANEANLKIDMRLEEIANVIEHFEARNLEPAISWTTTRRKQLGCEIDEAKDESYVANNSLTCSQHIDASMANAINPIDENESEALKDEILERTLTLFPNAIYQTIPCQRQRLRTLHFDLIRLRFLQIANLGAEHTQYALAYAQQHFKCFPERADDIKQLLGCLLYIGNLSDSPYRIWFNKQWNESSNLRQLPSLDSLWTASEHELRRELNFSIGCSTSDPLSELLDAAEFSISASITTQKLIHMAKHGDVSIDQSEVSMVIDLPREKIHHSIFVCPVTKEVSPADQPPLMLRCGHVISANAIDKIVRGLRISRKFKCPTCPCDQNPSELLELHF